MRKDGRSPGEVEEAIAAARIPRLKTDTCLRHMRGFSGLLDFAIFDGLRADNPMKPNLWTGREVANRKSREQAAQRLNWGNRLPGLLSSPIFRQPLNEPGDPLFWAPLLSVLAGLRMEETLQLRVDDFDTEDGMPFVWVQISSADQRLKADSSKRQVPLHRNLIDLGILNLVCLRRAKEQGRIFTHLERGKSKGTLSEVFSKRFTYYRKSNGIYDPRRDFHSLRTEFNTRLTRANVPRHSRKALMGHANNDITDANYYRAGDTIEILKEYVDRVDIDCSEIRRPVFE